MAEPGTEVAVDSSGSPEWSATLHRVSKSLVNIKMEVAMGLEGDPAYVSQGTGFVVDEDLGLILTNRHIATAGWAKHRALFVASNEEAPAAVVYRDPVHDFAILRCSVGSLKHTTLQPLRLDPSAAQVGVEIRVVGNDAGEKLSVLAGTIARTDRNPPEYGRVSWNDYNTFYIGAASATSGGSSGSPVVDIHGTVIALNAGGSTSSANAMYLPLDRVTRALELVREGRYVARGDIHARLLHIEFHELVRLGLPDSVDEEMRAADDGRPAGMLVVNDVLAGGVADRSTVPRQQQLLEAGGGAGEEADDAVPPAPGLEHRGWLEVGDILVRINGRLSTSFVDLDAALDEAMEGQAASSTPPLTATSWGNRVLPGGKVEALPDQPDGHDPVIRFADDPNSPVAAPCAASTGRERGRVGRVSLQVVRSGKLVDVDLPVADAHALVPRRFLSIGGSAMYEISHVRALLNGQRHGTVVINPLGFVFRPIAGATSFDDGISIGDLTLHAINGKRVTCLADAAAMLAALPEGYFSVSISLMIDPNAAPQTSICYWSTRFHVARVVARSVSDDIALAAEHNLDRLHELCISSRWRVAPLPEPPAMHDGNEAELDEEEVAKRNRAFSLSIARVLRPVPAQDPSTVGGEDMPAAIRSSVLASEEVRAGAEAAAEEEDADEEEDDDGADEEEDDDGADEEEDDDGEDEEGIELSEEDARGLVQAFQEKAGTRLHLMRGDDGDGAAGSGVAELLQAMVGGEEEEEEEEEGDDANEPTTAAKLMRRSRESQLDNETQEEIPTEVRRAAFGLVNVEARLPLRLEGCTQSGPFTGVGVLLDRTRSIVLVDRGTVPIMAALVVVVVGTTRLPARVLFLHPSANFGLIQFDTMPLARGAKRKSHASRAEIAHQVSETLLEECPLSRRGLVDSRTRPEETRALQKLMSSTDKSDMEDIPDILYIVTLQNDGSLQVAPTPRFTDAMNIARALPGFSELQTFRAFNLLAFGLVQQPGGMVVDRRGRVCAFLADFNANAPIVVSVEAFGSTVRQVLRRIYHGSPLRARHVPALLDFLPLGEAQAAFGLSPARAAQLLNRVASNELMLVNQLVGGSEASEVLRSANRKGTSRAHLRTLTRTLSQSMDQSRGRTPTLAEGDLILGWTPTAEEVEQLAAAAKEEGALDAALRRAVQALSLLTSPFGLSLHLPAPRPGLLPYRPVTSVQELNERASNTPHLRLRVLRSGREVDVVAHTEPVDLRGTSAKEVVLWAGLYLHAPDAGLLRRRNVPHVELPELSTELSRQLSSHSTVASNAQGLPLDEDGEGNEDEDATAPLQPLRGSRGPRVPAGVVCSATAAGTEASTKMSPAWVLAIADTPVASLSDVLFVVSRLPKRCSVRVVVAHLATGRRSIVTLRTDPDILPTVRFVHGADFRWHMENVETIKAATPRSSPKLLRQSTLSHAPTDIAFTPRARQQQDSREVAGINSPTPPAAWGEEEGGGDAVPTEQPGVRIGSTEAKRAWWDTADTEDEGSEDEEEDEVEGGKKRPLASKVPNAPSLPPPELDEEDVDEGDDIEVPGELVVDVDPWRTLKSVIVMSAVTGAVFAGRYALAAWRKR